MNWKCLAIGCKWDGCICVRCGRSRDYDHDWNRNCEKCPKCGMSHGNVTHDWLQDCAKCARCGVTREKSHQWNGCRCNFCFTTRDEGHDFSKDCERCARCGKKEIVGHFTLHIWNGCKCSKCESIRDEGHNWDGCTCRVCGKTKHRGSGFICSVCGKMKPVEANKCCHCDGHIGGLDTSAGIGALFNEAANIRAVDESDPRRRLLSMMAKVSGGKKCRSCGRLLCSSCAAKVPNECPCGDFFEFI